MENCHRNLHTLCIMKSLLHLLVNYLPEQQMGKVGMSTLHAHKHTNTQTHIRAHAHVYVRVTDFSLPTSTHRLTKNIFTIAII